MNHYHIRWSTGTLDWEAFETEQAAAAAAKELARRGETFTIELLGTDCLRCHSMGREIEE
jgi:hypothetical protein